MKRNNNLSLRAEGALQQNISAAAAVAMQLCIIMCIKENNNNLFNVFINTLAYVLWVALHGWDSC